MSGGTSPLPRLTMSESSTDTLHDGKHTSDTSMFRHGLMCKTLVFIASIPEMQKIGHCLEALASWWWVCETSPRGFADRKTALRGTIGVAPPLTGSHLEWVQERSASSARSAMVGRLSFWPHQAAPARRGRPTIPARHSPSLGLAIGGLFFLQGSNCRELHKSTSFYAILCAVPLV